MEYSAITGEFRMAFDGHENTFANSLFHTHQRQANVNVGGGSSSEVGIPFISIPSASQQEQDSTSYAPWSHTIQDDPNELITCAQTSAKSRRPFDNADCDGETDLQVLVSNILDEADSQDSYNSEGTLPTCNPIWSPKILREELLQYFQSEAKTQHNPSFTPNHVSQESFSKAQQLSADKDVEELMQQSSGLASNQQCHFNGDLSTPHSQKLPTKCLPMSNTGSTYPSQMQQNKHVSMPSYNNRGNSQPFNNFPNISDICRPQSEIITPCFESFYEDNCIRGNGKPVGNEQYVPEDMNQLVSSFQSFKEHGRDSIYYGDLTNMQKQVVGMHHEDNTAEQWKITSPTVSKQSPGMQIPKQLGELGTVQRERTRGASKQTFKQDGFQELPDFYPQCNPECFQQPKQFSILSNLPNQYYKIMHRENVNASMNQYSKHHIQHSRLQNKTKPQVQKEKKKMQASGFQREGFTRRPQFTHMREGDAQLFSQNLYFQENMQFKRFDREKSMVTAGHVQQFMPFMYPINDPRRYSGMPINSNFSSKSTLPYASSVPGMDLGDVMSSNESAAFNSYHSDMRTHRGENTYHGMRTSMLMNDGGPAIQLYFHLDECYEQWRCLEKERKGTEVILTKTFLKKRTPGVTNSNLPKAPPNLTRVDHLIVNQTREHAKVANLLERMECLCGITLPKDIHAALNRHHMAIWITQARFNEDIVNMTKHQWQRPHFKKDRDTMLVNMALKDLVATTRQLRTALWCALQMTLTKPIKTQDHHINKEDANKERCPSPFEGYSFRL